LHFTDLTDWLANGLLPTLILILGALLFVRFVQWVGSRYRTNLDRQMRESIEQGLVASEETKRSRAVAEVIEWSLITVTWVVAALLAIRQLGIPLTTLVAPATVVGVALGFGAQQVVGDLLAGFFLFSERQFGIGDLIRLSQPGSTAGVTGTVEELTLRVTKLRTASGEFVVVPNSALRQVTNLSKDWSRVVLDIPVAATEDLDRATSVLLDAGWQSDPWQLTLQLDSEVPGAADGTTSADLIALMDKYGFDGRTWQHWQEMRDALDQGAAVLILCDNRYLTPRSYPPGAAWEAMHWIRAVVASDRDDLVYIYDPLTFLPQSAGPTYQGPMASSFDGLNDAISATPYWESGIILTSRVGIHLNQR